MDPDRLDALEYSLSALKRRSRLERWALLTLLAAMGLGWASSVEAGRMKPSVMVGDNDTLRTAALTGNGLVFTEEGDRKLVVGPEGITLYRDGSPAISMDASEPWTGVTVFADDGVVAASLGVGDSHTSLKLFSPAKRTLRVELAEQLLDAGSGLRLYDRDGQPRTTVYADRRGEAGLELTDADRQPRVDVYAKADGVSVIRANDSENKALTELSVIPQSDVTARRTGLVPEEIPEDEPLVPMLYLLEGTERRVITPSSE